MSVLLAALALTAQPVSAPLPADVTLESGALRVRWTASGPVDVLVGASPDGQGAQQVSAADADGEHVIPHDPEAGRVYIVLRAADGTETITALRLLPLEGGRNFRDLGGYVTEDGRTVRWGRVYRSGVMDGLTPADYRYLSGLGISVICDFRASSERAEEPTDWAAGPVDYVAWDYELDMSGFAAAFTGEMSAERSREIFAGFYRQIPYQFADRYADMFDRLAAGEIPLAFNCSAGKDRTGVAAALILTALGVPRETVLADYALSDQYVDYRAELALDREAAAESEAMAFWANLPEDVLAPFLMSDPVYLEAAFAQIEADHGDVQTYLRDIVGVTPEELERLRAALLD